jgi:hypothetical protein
MWKWTHRADRSILFVKDAVDIEVSPHAQISTRACFACYRADPTWYFDVKSGADVIRRRIQDSQKTKMEGRGQATGRNRWGIAEQRSGVVRSFGKLLREERTSK